MNSLIKNICIKLPLIFFLISGLLLVSESDVEARFIKKLTIEPLSDPVDWVKSFKPGTVFGLLLENSLADSGQFQMVKFPEIPKTKKETNITRNIKISKEDAAQDSKIENMKKVDEKVDQGNVLDPTSSIKVSLAQYQIRGNIIIFNPDTDPLKAGHTKKDAMRHRERAVVKATIELIHLHTGRSLAKRKFTTVSIGGRTASNSNWTKLDYKSGKFKSYSIGKAVWKLNDLVKTFILKTLNEVPLEGDLISVDHRNKNVLINLGKTNGVRVQDVFTVFSVTTGFNDPVDKVDLGDMYTRKGIIMISEVQGRFSRAKVLVGLDFVPGDLVVPKTREPKKSRPKDQSLQNDIIWGPYKGLPSLSY